MGLDISFNRKAAEKAGLQFKIIPNGGTYDSDDELEYIDWCRASQECVTIPGIDYYVSNDSGSEEHVMVRANKWGSTYAPLTAWLKEHDITWREF